jgi:hypothetical protein
MVQYDSALQSWLPDFSRRNVPKLGKYTKLPRNYQMAVMSSKWTYNISNLFHSKALHNYPKLGFLVWKYIIWQPWLQYFPKFLHLRWPRRQYICWNSSLLFLATLRTKTHEKNEQKRIIFKNACRRQQPS